MVKKEYKVLKFNQVEWPKLPFSSIIVINLKLQHKVSDSQSAISLAKNPVFHSRCKHIQLRYHFIRELIGIV